MFYGEITFLYLNLHSYISDTFNQIMFNFKNTSNNYCTPSHKISKENKNLIKIAKY